MLRRRLLGSLALGGALPMTPLATAQTTPLQLGVLPHVSARVLLTNYQPLRTHLEAALGRAVEVVTASNFKDFHERSTAGSYDVAITAANLGRVAHADGRLSTVAIFEPRIPGLFVMHKERPLKQIEELRGKAVAVANPRSLVVLKGLGWLKERKLIVGQDFKLEHAANEDSLGQLLRSGEAPFAMMSMGEFRAIAAELRERLEVFTEFAKVPGFFVQLKTMLPAGEADRLRAALFGFSASDAGRQFAATTGTQQIRAIQDADIRELDDVVEETRLALR